MKQLIAFPILAAVAAPALAAAPIQGHWTNPKRNVVIEIAPCGPALCGTVVSASPHAINVARKGGTDNLIGAQLMSGFRPAGDGYRGRAFDPKRNLHGSATIRLSSANTLDVQGCALAGLICREQHWTRVGR